jgi:methyl acetate hydrolase
MSSLAPRLDELLAARVASASERGSGRTQADVAGVTALISNGEGVLYQGAHGVPDIRGAEPLAPDAIFYTASMTKAITGAAIMQLVEQGRLSLDEPAADLLPELAEIQVLEGFDADGTPRLRQPKRPMTLRHLLTHTAGFGYETWNQEILAYTRKMGLPERSRGMRIDLNKPLLFDPGERWNYSIAIDWAGLMLEAATGERLGAYMQRELFEPLGMVDTGFRVPEEKRQRIMCVHRRHEDGSLAAEAPMPAEPAGDMDRGGGGLFSTVADYGAFVRMILNLGRAGSVQVLKPETVELMGQNHIGPLRTLRAPTALPAVSNDFEFFPDVPKAWGLTFQINLEQAPTGRSAGSLAWAGLTNCYYWIDPKRQVGGVFASQILPFFDARAVRLFLDYETAVYRAMA